MPGQCSLILTPFQICRRNGGYAPWGVSRISVSSQKGGGPPPGTIGEISLTSTFGAHQKKTTAAKLTG
jgi:hypothetical protein